MTKVKLYRKHDTVTRVVVSGHALSGEYGHDVVCAGISTVITGICNALEELTDYDESQIIFEEGYVEIPNLSDDEKVQWTIEIMAMELKTIEKVYSDYIEISYL